MLSACSLAVVFCRLVISVVVYFFCTVLFLVFFFFKQKTAYEMRISDWSSDVCSSDLKPVTLFPYGLISRHGLPHTDGLYILHEGPLGVFRDKAGDSGTLKDFSYKDIVSDKAVE